MKYRFIIGILGIILNVNLPATAAESGTRGGGDVFICFENGVNRVYLADTYESFSKADHFKSELLEHSLVRFVIGAVSMKISIENPLISADKASELIRSKYETIGGRIEEVDEDLPDLPDDNIQSLPPSCLQGQKKQLAIQDLVTKKIRVNRDLRSRLGTQEKLFELHEAIIGVRDQLGLDTQYTTETRDVVAEGFRRATEIFDQMLLPGSVRSKVGSLLALLTFEGNNNDSDRPLKEWDGVRKVNFFKGYEPFCSAFRDGLAFVFGKPTMDLFRESVRSMENSYPINALRLHWFKGGGCVDYAADDIVRLIRDNRVPNSETLCADGCSTLKSNVFY